MATVSLTSYLMVIFLMKMGINIFYITHKCTIPEHDRIDTYTIYFVSVQISKKCVTANHSFTVARKTMHPPPFKFRS